MPWNCKCEPGFASLTILTPVKMLNTLKYNYKQHLLTLEPPPCPSLPFSLKDIQWTVSLWHVGYYRHEQSIWILDSSIVLLSYIYKVIGNDVGRPSLLNHLTLRSTSLCYIPLSSGCWNIDIGMTRCHRINTESDSESSTRQNFSSPRAVTGRRCPNSGEGEDFLTG